MIQTEEQYTCSVEYNLIEWCTGGPWFNEIICWNLHGTIFEELFITPRQYIYDLMCRLHDYEKESDKSTDTK